MNIFEENQRLFSQSDLRAFLEGKTTQMLREIEQYDQTKLLNTSPHDLTGYFAEKFRVEPLQLRTDEIHITTAETLVDVHRDQDRRFRNPSGPFHVPGTRVAFHIPFAGDRALFDMVASTRTYSPPGGSVSGGEVVVAYQVTEGGGAEQVKSKFANELREIAQHVGWIATDVAGFDRTLKLEAGVAIDKRRKRLLESQSMVADLGYPMRERTDAPRTYAVPEVRRKLMPAPPSASSAPFVPEPALDLQHYEHILDVIQNMVLVMERSPSAFQTMSEEDLRQHFLVQLNAQYEGAATGETFNYEGKTDILIRANAKNIFIGECKFWDGPASLTRAIDQVLGYASWRDTKVAVLVFNRGGTFTDVLAKIPGTLTDHPSFKRDLLVLGETRLRGVFRHRDDPNRELTLTVAAFDVPGAKADVSPSKGPRKAAKTRKRD